MLSEQRLQVVKTAQKAQKMGLLPLTFGNLSLRDVETGYICITPSGLEYSEMEPEDILVIDVAGKIIEGKRKPSTETPLHCRAYQERADIYGVCHTHSTFATAWASSANQLPVVVAELAALVGGTVETAPYRPMGTPELAEVVVAALGNKHAVLMANHGVLTVGYDLNTAFANAVVIEEGARVAYYVYNIGGGNIIPEDECQRLREWVLRRYGQ